MNISAVHRCLYTVIILIGILLLTTCQYEPHIHPATSESDGELIIGLSTESEIPINNIHIFLFNASGLMVSHAEYTDPRLIATSPIYLHAGYYTILAAINIDRELTFETNSTLLGISDILKHNATTNIRLYCGLTSAEVRPSTLTRADIFLHNGITDIGIATIRICLPPLSWDMPEYVPGSRSFGNSQPPIRCIAELRHPDTGKILLHKVHIPQNLDNGSSFFDITVTKGIYDLLILTESSAYKPRYNTEHLEAITVSNQQEAPQANYPPPAAASIQNVNAINDTTITVIPKPVAGAYRLIATDLPAYRKLSDENCITYPPLTSIKVTVEYTGYYPCEFNVFTGKVTDAKTGFSHTFIQDLTDEQGSETIIFQSEILAHAQSSVTANITISDMISNKEICRIQNLRIAYDAGHITTIRSAMFTQGINPGGITIDTDWDDIIIYF